MVEVTAKITNDHDVKTVAENQSVYIYLRVVYRIENLGKLPLTLIEVQSRSYLGDDDIIS